MDHSQPYVRLIFDTISDEAEAARRSCVQLLLLVRAQSSVASGEAARVRLAQFDAREYFNASMDVTTFHLRAGDFRSDFLSLPEERTSIKHALIRSFLAKLPSSLKAEKKQLEVKLLECEVLNTPLPWKFEQLVQLAANYNILAARETAIETTVNAADASQKSKQFKPSANKNAASQPCPCCGKAGHYARDCPTTCSVCKHRSCPGNYGSPCVVTAASMPQTVLNALGKPLPPAIKRILVKAHQTKDKPRPTSASANVCQANTIDTSNFTDNFWGDEPGEHKAEANMLQLEPHQYAHIDVDEAEAWLDEWRLAEVRETGNRNVTLPLCHGTRELQEHTASGGVTWRVALRSGDTTIDIGNAYGRGCRQRPPAYMLLGTSLRRFDESGVELCMELNTPHYGEEPSGDEWARTFDVDIVSIGWQPAEAVPALYYFLLPGGARASLIRVVDDVLLTYPTDARSVADKTIAKFNEYYHNDVSVCWDPDSFVGYAIIDDPDTGAVTLNMTSHIEHAVRQYVPALLADPPQRPSASLQRGESMQSLADSMRHVPAAAPLLPSQTQVQRIVGALRYPEKVLPVLTLGLHRLSCVAQNPPPVASRVAELLLQLAYDHRFEGLTFGGAADLQAAGLDATFAYGVPEQDRPPDDLAACGDATWSTGIPSDLDKQHRLMQKGSKWLLATCTRSSSRSAEPPFFIRRKNWRFLWTAPWLPKR